MKGVQWLDCSVRSMTVLQVLMPGFGWVEGLSIGSKRTVQERWHPLGNLRRGLTGTLWYRSLSESSFSLIVFELLGKIP